MPTNYPTPEEKQAAAALYDTTKLLPFSHNWNNKLYCEYFTTIRLHNPQKYSIGKFLTCTMKGEEMGLVRVESVRTFPLRNLTAHMAGMDMGMTAADGRRLLERFYQNSNDATQFDFVLLRKLTAWQPPSNTVKP